jgi:ferric-dicitrate binding protein FerR (iron transport regulator)
MNAEERDLLHRHLNGDLNASEEAAFFARLQTSPELRRELASQALDETLLSELILEGRTVARPSSRRRAWVPVSIAAAMLLGLTLILSLGRGPSLVLRVTSFEGAAVLQRGGKEEPMYPGQDLRWGDRVTTNHGEVVLERKGLRLEIGPDSTFEFRRPKGVELLSVEKGVVRATVSSEQNHSFGIQQGTLDTKDASIRVEVASHRTLIDVERGSVELERQPGVPITAGNTISVSVTDLEIGRLIGRSRVDEAVRRAAHFLESRRMDLVTPMVSEKRHGTAPRRTYAELALLALHRAGIPDTHPLKSELLGLVKGRSIESTYVAALQAMALAEIDPVAHHARIRLCAQLLVDSQCANGQWDYAVKPALSDDPAALQLRRRQEGPASGDNSVTSYAVLGLSACSRAGILLDPDVVERARRWWIQCQNEDGGWGYNDSGNRNANDTDKRTLTTNASYGSASASAVASLAALRGMREGEGRPDNAILRGLEWLGANFSVDRNPRKDPGFTHGHWLLAASRAGTILGTERFGSHEWYAEGADFLLQAQQPTGGWRLEQGEFMAPEKNDVLDTCLAILFLRRAP